MSNRGYSVDGKLETAESFLSDRAAFESAVMEIKNQEAGYALLWEDHMRKVAILEDPGAQRCWVAVDEKLREPVLRVHDRGLLERICQSLDWKIVQTNSQRSRSG
jgi:hypothetical protein